VPELTSKDVSLLVRRNLYRGCVRSCMLDDSEIWLVKKEKELTLQQAEIRMSRWMMHMVLK